MSAQQSEHIKQLLTGMVDHVLQAVSDPQVFVDEACAAFEFPESFEAAAAQLGDVSEQSAGAPAEPSAEDQAALAHYRSAQDGVEALTGQLRQLSEQQLELIGSDFDQYAEGVTEMINQQVDDYVGRLDQGEFVSAEQANQALKATAGNIRTATGRVQASVLGPEQAERLEQMKQQADKQVGVLLEQAMPPLSEFLAYACFERELISEDEAMAYLRRVGEATLGPAAEVIVD